MIISSTLLSCEMVCYAHPRIATWKVYSLFIRECQLYPIKTAKHYERLAVEFGIHLHQADGQQGLGCMEAVGGEATPGWQN